MLKYQLTNSTTKKYVPKWLVLHEGKSNKTTGIILLTYRTIHVREFWPNSLQKKKTFLAWSALFKILRKFKISTLFCRHQRTYVTDVRHILHDTWFQKFKLLLTEVSFGRHNKNTETDRYAVPVRLLLLHLCYHCSLNVYGQALLFVGKMLVTKSSNNI
jgi:hypothetical protein